jgi:hypothetical protein
MLINFRVSNYKSLREPQVLDLRSVYDQGRGETVGVAALYGANASGKSNLLKAIRFMHGAVTGQNEWNKGEKIRRSPFLLDDECRGLPSSFAIELMLHGIPYSYGFSVMDSQEEEASPLRACRRTIPPWA